MRAIITTLCMAILVSSTMGETFKLKDTATNKLHGPFHFKHGSHIKIGTTEWELERIDPRRDKIIAEMKKVKIPSLQFRDASLKDVVLFVSETVRRLGHEGMDIVLGPDASTDESTTILLSVKDMSLHDCLAYICEMTHTEWDIRHGVIILERENPKEKTLTPPETTGTNGDAPFYLTNTSTKKAYGPFQLKDKSYIRIDDTILSINQDAAQTKAVELLKELQLPNFNFRNASVKYVVLFLNEPINSTAGIKLTLDDRVDAEKHMAWCSVQKPSMYDVLGILCELTGLQWTVRDGVVVLEEESP